MILKHRDTEVLRFDWLEPQGVRVVSVNDKALRFLPLEMHGEPTDERLWAWLRHRIVPSHRAHVQDMLLKLGYDAHDTRGIIRLCRGLSVNDVFWVVEDSFDGRWREYNLYDNAFSDTVALMAFTGGGSFARQQWTSSPEFTTNGMLAKCWRRRDGVVTLYKSGTEGAVNAGFEPYSEFYAAQIAEAMDLPHAAYGLSMFKGRLCSTSPLFTSDKFGFIPAGRLVDVREALADPRFADVFFFDALIFNTDRHLGNFGYLVNNDTNEIVGAAPIFDNGYGLFSLAVYKDGDGNEFDDLRKFLSRVHPALYANWLGFSNGLTKEMIARLERLKGFRFKQHDNFNLPTDRLRVIEDFLQRRVGKILTNGLDADDFLKIDIADDTLSGKSGIGDTLATSQERHLSILKDIIDNMQADPFITAQELAEMAGVSRVTMMRYIKELQLAGAIVRKGGRKTGFWSVDRMQFDQNFGMHGGVK